MIDINNDSKVILADVTVIIMTNNEERHIERCLLSIKDFIKKIVIIDSFSTDNTLNIIKKYNVEVLQHEWISYSSQLNWGIENANVKTEWIFRLDPDEIASKILAKKICSYLNNLSSKTSGVSIVRRLVFLEKEINFGGDFPQKGVRIWRNRRGKCDNTWSDEHIIVDGNIEHINLDIVDNNLNNISWWTAKHNKFATRETIEFFLQRERKEKNKDLKLAKREKLKKNLKFKIYYNLPIGLRPFLFFIYKYIFRLGFLNGWQGLAWCFLQGFWYRFLVDLKIMELKKIMKHNNLNLQQAVKNEYGYDI